MSQPTPRFRGWRAAGLAGDPRWIFHADPGLVDADNRALDTWLAPLRWELLHGWGVAWVRGLGDLPEPHLRRLFLAIGRAIGQPDTTYGELYAVTDTGESHLERAIPVSQTRAATSMHTDSSQIATHPRWVGLACVRQAPEGGGSRLASAVAVHDHLAQHHPAALQRLYRSFIATWSPQAATVDHTSAWRIAFRSIGWRRMAPVCVTCATGSKRATPNSRQPCSLRIAKPSTSSTRPSTTPDIATTCDCRLAIYCSVITIKQLTTVKPIGMIRRRRG